MKNLMIAILAAVFAFTVRAQGEGARRAQYDGSLQKGAEPDSVSGRPRLQESQLAKRFFGHALTQGSDLVIHYYPLCLIIVTCGRIGNLSRRYIELSLT